MKNLNVKNIHGYCPHCNADLDGDLVIDSLIKFGYPQNEVIEYAKYYQGYSEYGEFNRFTRKIGIYDVNKDRTIKWRCPDCKKTWGR